MVNSPDDLPLPKNLYVDSNVNMAGITNTRFSLYTYIVLI